MIESTQNINVASLNGNRLVKLSDTTKRNHLIRFLREQSPHIIALQETYCDAPELQSQLHRQFRAHSSVWTYRCGLVSLSPLLNLTRIPIPEDDRSVFAQVSHTSNHFMPFYILVIYAPAGSAPLRRAFFTDLFAHAPFSDSHDRYSRLLLLGDFNFSL